MYYNIIYICLIISAFVCQASGKKYILQTKNKDGGTKPVEDGGCKPVKKTDLGGSFGSDYMDGGGYYSTLHFKVQVACAPLPPY